MTAPTAFSVTWDYRCPYARNAAEHVVAGLEGGAPWDVTFTAFSLDQVHVHDGDGPDVWTDPDKRSALLPMQVGIAVRDKWPWGFRRVHLGIFRARFEGGLDTREDDVLATVLTDNGVDADAVFAEVSSGRPLATFRAEHEAAVSGPKVFGVPTFMAAGEAVFVRLMHRPGKDAGLARATVERVLDLLDGWPDLNEFKRTTIPR